MARADRVRNGKLSLLSPDHPMRRKMKCQHCGKVGRLGNMMRWHGDNCKART